MLQHRFRVTNTRMCSPLSWPQHSPLQAAPNMYLVWWWPSPPRLPVMSRPMCCNSEARHPASYRERSCAKEEQWRRMQRSGHQVSSGCSTVSKLATTGRTYADAAAAPKPEANDQTVKTTALLGKWLQ